MPDSAPTRHRIVPDVDQSLTAQHLRHPRGPSIWPLWLMIFLILILLAGAGAAVWYERERMQQELYRLSGEVSNMHARLDAGSSDVEENLAIAQAQLATLFQEQEQLAIALTDTRQEFFSLQTEEEAAAGASSEALDSLNQQISRIEANGELRDDQLEAIHISLQSLEQAGTEGRQNLIEEVAHLEQRLEQQGTRLEREIAQLQEEVLERQEALAQRSVDQQTLDEALAEFAERDSAEDDEELVSRINTLAADVRQVRQAQLAFSAQLEMLR
ncbi:hypothetical protein R5M92_04660 [Halomonas sp. Bachu 37]|uniref:hypothetical protein n=1 Tax=Halomonas kashgarensis TaxID=3084920 RepID=UPI003217625B